MNGDIYSGVARESVMLSPGKHTNYGVRGRAPWKMFEFLGL